MLPTLSSPGLNRLFRRPMLPIAIAPFLFPSLDLPARLALQVRESDRSRLFLFTGDGKFELDNGTPLRWSPNGRFLIVRAPQGRLRQVDSAGTKPKAYDLPSDWTAVIGWDRTSLLGLGKEGVEAVNAFTPDRPELRIPGATMAAYSEDRSKVAFSRPKEGVWTAFSDGTAATQILTSSHPAGIAWTPDGRRMAFNVGKPLFLWRPGEPKPTQISKSASSASWSSGARFLLANAGTFWSVFDRVTKKWDELKGIKSPSWLRSRRLLGVANGELRMIELSPGAMAYHKVDLPLEGKVEAAAGYDGLRLEDEGDPFASLPRPTAFETRVQGYVERFDPYESTLVLRVARIVESNGQVGGFAFPQAKTYKIDAANQKAFTTPCDAEVVAYVVGDSIRKLYTEGDMGGAPAPSANRPVRTNLDPDGVSHDAVTVPLIFPVIGKVNWSDSFLAPRGGGTRRHHGQDLMSAKMTPLVAAFDGVVRFRRDTTPGGSAYISLEGDNGFRAMYIHMNNDTPGTDDGLGLARFAYAPNLESGDRVVAGQFLGWVGDSGNAETTAPHCHFELHDSIGGGVLNAVYSLKEARKITEPVYADPMPQATLQAGETRWDGVVTSVDANSNRATIELVAVDTGDGIKVQLMPKQLTFVWDKPIPLRNNLGVTVDVSRLQAKNSVTLVGKPGANGSGPSVRAVWFDIR